jgi:hypothetical protein
MKYRKKPVVIDAIQWTGDNYAEVFEFTEGDFYPTKPHDDTLALLSNDDVKVEKGDYIVRIAPGAYSICKEAAFNKIYEPVK